MVGQEIRMKFGTKTETFVIKSENPTKDKGMHYFLECSSNPAARGFYSMDYIKSNSVV